MNNIVNDLEKLIDHACHGCGKAHEAKFFSLFVGSNHYIIGDCNHCNYRIELRTDQFGAGIFMPDGKTTTNSLPEQNTAHMPAQLEQENKKRTVSEIFSTHKLRIVPDEELRKR